MPPPEELVADGMPEGVVDHLEPVEVKEEHRQEPVMVVALRLGKSQVEELVEQLTVGKAG